MIITIIILPWSGSKQDRTQSAVTGSWQHAGSPEQNPVVLSIHHKRVLMNVGNWHDVTQTCVTEIFCCM